MILFHGTSLENGEQIIKDGKIKCQIKRVHEGYKNIIPGTTDGYVYLTQNFYTAYYYGNIPLISLEDMSKQYVYIFKIEIDDNSSLFEPDLDELQTLNITYSNNITWEESIEKCGCLRIKQDIITKGLEYIKLPGTMNDCEGETLMEICQDMSEMQKHMEKEDEEFKKVIAPYLKWYKII